MTAATTLSASKVAERYGTALADLQFNSRPVINVLSMLAEDHVEFAAMIAAVIEKQLLSCSTPQKQLPLLYLMDSIMKNSKSPQYIKHFEKDIVQVFSAVFEKADVKMRADMYKLRCTWNHIFSERVLHLLDLRVKAVDPAWPVVVKQVPKPVVVSTSIKPASSSQNTRIKPAQNPTTTTVLPEVNNNNPPSSAAVAPKRFLSAKDYQRITQVPPAPPVQTYLPPMKTVSEPRQSRPVDPRLLKRPATSTPPATPVPLANRNTSSDPVHSGLVDAQVVESRTALSSPPSKRSKPSSDCENEDSLMPSLFADKDVDMRVFMALSSSTATVQGRSPLEVPQVVSTTSCSVAASSATTKQEVVIEEAVVVPEKPSSSSSSKPVITANHILQNLLRPNSPMRSLQPKSSILPVSLGQLVPTGNLPSKSPTRSAADVVKQQPSSIDSTELLKFNIGHMCVRNEHVISALNPAGKRCSTCGVRLADQSAEAYAAHLDWHFRQNLQSKTKTKTPTRAWLTPLTEWLAYSDESLMPSQANYGAKNEAEDQKKEPKAPGSPFVNTQIPQVCA